MSEKIIHPYEKQTKPSDLMNKVCPICGYKVVDHPNAKFLKCWLGAIEIIEDRTKDIQHYIEEEPVVLKEKDGLKVVIEWNGYRYNLDPASNL